MAADLRREFNEKRDALEFFDANAWFGPSAPAFEVAETAEQLDGILRFSYIRGALVTHTAALSYDWREGDELTLAGVDGRHYRAAVVLVPDSTGEVGDLDEWLDRASAVRLFPKSHGFSMSDWCCGPLLGSLQERKLPLILWHSESSWDVIRDLCERYPKLPVIIEGTGRKILYDNRMFYKVLADCSNLHLELHNLTNYLVVEDIVPKFGAGRLIFGSYAPFQSPSAAMMTVTHARVSDEDKQMIAGGNMRRLIGEVVR